MRRLHRRHILQLRLRCARAAPLHAADRRGLAPSLFRAALPRVRRAAAARRLGSHRGILHRLRGGGSSRAPARCSRPRASATARRSGLRPSRPPSTPSSAATGPSSGPTSRRASRYSLCSRSSRRPSSCRRAAGTPSGPKLWTIDPALLSAGGGHTGASAFAFAAGLASGGSASWDSRTSCSAS